MAGELATFTTNAKRPPKFPAYRHDRLRETFDPVMVALRESLSVVLEQSAIPIPLEAKKFGISVAIVADRALYSTAVFVLAARADVPSEELRRRFPAQLKIGPVEKIRDLVTLQLPGVPVRSFARRAAADSVSRRVRLLRARPERASCGISSRARAASRCTSPASSPAWPWNSGRSAALIREADPCRTTTIRSIDRTAPCSARVRAAGKRGPADTGAAASGARAVRPRRSRVPAASARAARCRAQSARASGEPALAARRSAARFARRRWTSPGSAATRSTRFASSRIRRARPGVANEIVLAARYVLCAALDEAVLSTPWGAQSEWAQHPLLVALHREAWGGEKFFEMLDRVSTDPRGTSI